MAVFEILWLDFATKHVPLILFFYSENENHVYMYMSYSVPEVLVVVKLRWS